MFFIIIVLINAIFIIVWIKNVIQALIPAAKALLDKIRKRKVADPTMPSVVINDLTQHDDINNPHASYSDQFTLNRQSSPQKFIEDESLIINTTQNRHTVPNEPEIMESAIEDENKVESS